jgi:hypothetical protein
MRADRQYTSTVTASLRRNDSTVRGASVQAWSVGCGVAVQTVAHLLCL